MEEVLVFQLGGKLKRQLNMAMWLGSWPMEPLSGMYEVIPSTEEKQSHKCSDIFSVMVSTQQSQPISKL